MNCLANGANDLEIEDRSTFLSLYPGQIYDLNDQCRIAYGHESRYIEVRKICKFEIHWIFTIWYNLILMQISINLHNILILFYLPTKHYDIEILRATKMFAAFSNAKGEETWGLWMEPLVRTGLGVSVESVYVIAGHRELQVRKWRFNISNNLNIMSNIAS